MSSRLKMTAKNALWSYISMFISLILQFISRTVFIYYLGEEYLGINGLFSNVLGVLSFAELGIGTAINFSLYKPVAEHNTEKIKAYMYYYKWAYRAIALIITVLGLGLIPFMDVLVKNPGNIGNITLYYLIYLFNTVTSYFVSYKYSLVNAEQKNYIYTIVNLILSMTTIIVQIISILLWKSFLIYLIVVAVFGVVQKIFVSIYFDRMYPFLREKNIVKLTLMEKNFLIQKIKALIIHKIGDVSVHQTDNIIVSACVSTRMVGVLSNYNLLISTISSCINILFNSVTGSLGNMSAIELKEYQYEIFKKYRFVGFWFYGFTSIALGILMTPFITLWIGKKMVVDAVVVNLLVLDYYMIGQRICLNNMKSAAGVFEPDKYIAFIQAIVNLVSSIWLVKLIGLPGVYLGTIIQGSISSIFKPILSYRILFNTSSKYYFMDSIKYGGTTLFAYSICVRIAQTLLKQITVTNFVLLAIAVMIIPNLIFGLFFCKSKEFQFFINLVKVRRNNKEMRKNEE